MPKKVENTSRAFCDVCHNEYSRFALIERRYGTEDDSQVQYVCMRCYGPTVLDDLKPRGRKEKA